MHDYVMTYLGCGLDRVERSERPKFGVLDLPMHADLISSDGSGKIFVVLT